LEWRFFCLTVAKAWSQYLQRGADVDFPPRLSVNVGLLLDVGFVAIVVCNPGGVHFHEQNSEDVLLQNVGALRGAQSGKGLLILTAKIV
jgi:hypothetical protein